MPSSRPSVSGRFQHTSRLRQRRADWAAATKELTKQLCGVQGCTSRAATYGRFCQSHATDRARQGAVDLLDVVSPETLKFTVDHLKSSRAFLSIIANKPVIERLDALTSGPEITPASPIQTPDPDRETFGRYARDLSFESQACFLWRHQRRLGHLQPPADLLTACVASRWVYLLLQHAGVLGLRQEATCEDGATVNWTRGDHLTAYRTLFGKTVAKGQSLYRQKHLPAGVIRRLAKDIEDNVFLTGSPSKALFPSSDAEFLEAMRPHEWRDRFVFDLIARHQQCAGQT